MGILTKEVEVIPSGKNIKYYKDLGYDVKWHKPLLVKIDDLSKGSKAKIEVLCDMCKQNKMLVTYDNYNSVVTRTGSYVCRDCFPKKGEQTVREKYNVSHVSQLESVKDRKKETCLKHYNTDYPMQSDIVKDVFKETMLNRYGAENALQVPQLKDKAMQSCVRIYGVNNPAQLPEIREKMVKTLYKNSSQKCSKQQLYIYNLFNITCRANLNFPISFCSVDICFPDEKIVLEYDGGFHDGRVKLGRMTQEEFDRKELIRDKVIKSEGYKIIRIKSSSDKLPSDYVLLQMLSEAKHYFQTTQHTWQTYDIDKSLLFNAENLNGIPYDFGSLRTIKESDLQTNNTIQDSEPNTVSNSDLNNNGDNVSTIITGTIL